MKLALIKVLAHRVRTPAPMEVTVPLLRPVQQNRKSGKYKYVGEVGIQSLEEKGLGLVWTDHMYLLGQRSITDRMARSNSLVAVDL